MISHAPKSPSPIIFAVILASASVVGLLIIVSPYILTYHDPGAISIGVSLNSTDVSQNQTIKVTVSDRNNLRFADELPLSGDWRVQNLSMGPCASYTANPYGIAVYQGRYAIDNISSAKSMVIYAPGFYGCPGFSFSNSFTFKPLQNATSYVELKGYWTAGETPISEGVLHPFLPGEYTLVAGDEWGHVDILYFLVTTSPSTTTTSAISASTTSSCISTTQMQTTSTSDSIVLEMGHMPANFTVGGYQFTTVYNGTGYETSSNGHSTVNLGWSLVYNVSNGAQTQTVTFGWAPDGPSSGTLPAPITTINGELSMLWVKTCTSMFLEIDTGGGATGTQTTATLSSSTAIATASVANSSDGLSLNLHVQPGGNGTFTITVYESNLLSSVNNVTEANHWSYPAGALDPYNNCAPSGPVGFAILQGYYGMNNYTSGKALPLYNSTVVFSCTENIVPINYLFQPTNDNFSAYQGRSFLDNGTASLSLLTGGYWTGGAGTPTSASFSEFRGVYTVLAADEWGNVLLLHFTVV